MMLRIGNHLPSSKGYLAMGKHAVKLGATTFAFFTRNPRGGTAKPIAESDVQAFLAFAAEHDIDHLVAHAPYTMNLCSAKPDIRQFGLNMLQDDMKRMEYTPHQYYNFHPGSHTGQGAEVGIEQIADALNQTLTPEQTTTVLLETMAGKGSEVGRSFEELRAILNRVQLTEKMGVCLDTCHIWDAGYNIAEDLDGVLTQSHWAGQAVRCAPERQHESLRCPQRPTPEAGAGLYWTGSTGAGNQPPCPETSAFYFGNA